MSQGLSAEGQRSARRVLQAEGTASVKSGMSFGHLMTEGKPVFVPRWEKGKGLDIDLDGPTKVRLCLGGVSDGINLPSGAV